ncbi:MAG: hypothetical protein NY202_01280 [Mollicutes bacterium UO1]
MDEKITNGYDEKKVPANKKHEQVKISRNNKKNQLEAAAKAAQVQPEIREIAAELNKEPVVANSELKTLDYQTEMLNLDADKTQRTQRKEEIIAEIAGIRKAKLDRVRAIITTATAIAAKNDATQAELASAVQDLELLAGAKAGSPEQIV